MQYGPVNVFHLDPRLSQKIPGIYCYTVSDHLKMEMRACAYTGATHIADTLTGCHISSLIDPYTA